MGSTLAVVKQIGLLGQINSWTNRKNTKMSGEHMINSYIQGCGGGHTRV